MEIMGKVGDEEMKAISSARKAVMEAWVCPLCDHEHFAFRCEEYIDGYGAPEQYCHCPPRFVEGS